MVKTKNKFIRFKSFILSTFLLGILFSYNNCSVVRNKDLLTKKSVRVFFDKNPESKIYKLKFSGHELKFTGAMLDKKVFSISKLTLYPHSDLYKEVVFFEEGRSLSIPLRVNSNDPLRNSALLRIKSENSEVNVILR